MGKVKGKGKDGEPGLGLGSVTLWRARTRDE
jgi:hypothetical protein